MTTTHTFTDLGDVRLVLKTGMFVITDPCYVFPDEMWADLCDAIFCREDKNKNCPESGVIEMDGHKIWWGQTKYGDGSYGVKVFGGKVGEFGVDAGMFAIFPLEFVEKYKPELVNDKSDSACKLRIDGGVVSYEDGNMDVGPVSVCTDDSDRDEDEDEDNEDEDYGDGR